MDAQIEEARALKARIVEARALKARIVKAQMVVEAWVEEVK